MTIFSTLFHRLGQSWRWLLIQLLLTPVLLLLGLAWTRIPEKSFLQVAATFLIPFLLIVSFFELEAGTMRAFARSSKDQTKPPLKLVWGAVAVGVCGVLLWVVWHFVDSFDNHIELWASYLNSQAHGHTRLLTFERIENWLTIAAWILRWIAAPALLLPFAAASAQTAHKLPWRKLLRFLFNWKWWAGVVVAALTGVLLPSRCFTALPSGSVHAQQWHIGLKLSGAYLLAIASWTLILAWLAVLLHPASATEDPAEPSLVPALVGRPDNSNTAKAQETLPK
jgi:magnesium-transporting ATPase (P-type)